MRLLVCGGRDFANREALVEAMNLVVGSASKVVVIHGGARGADSLADDIAKAAGVEVLAFPADWGDLSHPDARIKERRDGTRYDANAGHRRNQQMLDEGKPDIVLAAPGGGGTAMMIRLAEEAGVPVIKMPRG